MGVLTTRAGFPHGPPLSQSPGSSRPTGRAGNGSFCLGAVLSVRPTQTDRLSV